ncbi:MAG: type III pantothenate kinase [Spirochaetota bacterium]
MLLVIDVGNTNTVFGLFEEGQKEPSFYKRTVTRRDRTSDELGLFLNGFLRAENIAEKEVKHTIYSSVVPSFNPILERMLADWFNATPLQVDYQIKLPFVIKYPRPFEIGADRLVNAAAVCELYPGDQIIIDMGTATTFCVLSAEKEYLGGVIAPGLKIAMDSLYQRTSQLPPIVFQPPEKVLGDSTLESLQSGFFFGWVGLLESIIKEIKASYPEKSFGVVGTGGLVSTIHQVKPGIFDSLEPLLTLKGLEMLFQKNKN